MDKPSPKPRYNWPNVAAWIVIALFILKYTPGPFSFYVWPWWAEFLLFSSGVALGVSFILEKRKN
jgi:hypothetical protein